MSKSGVKVIKDKVLNMSKAMRALTMQSVLVGIPSEDGRNDEDGDLTNAEIGYVHEKGSPARNIPERPFLIPGIRAVQPKIVEQLRAAGKAALDGKVAGVNGCLERAGIIAQKSVRAQFVDNDWPELAEKTLNRRPVLARDEDGKPTKYGKSRKEKGRINPLIDSQQLRKAVTYVVKKGK